MNKLFTRPWAGFFCIIVMLTSMEMVFVTQCFQNGFTQELCARFAFSLVSFFILAFFYKEYSKREGIQIIPTIAGIIAFFINSQLAGMDWITVFQFMGLGLIVFFVVYSDSDHKSKNGIDNQPPNPQPTPKQPHFELDYTKPLQENVENAIRKFKPSKRYEYEIEYQNELYGWLSREFPVQYEVQTGASRPDLIIKNIAIEIKGPTGNRELDTLTTKFLKYSNHYPYFIIVLFDCKFSDSHFNEISSGITKFASHVKIIKK